MGLLIFWIYPLANGLWGSFTDWRAFQTDRDFIGLDNYRTLWNDDVFRTTLVNTCQYTLMYLPLNVAIGLGLALAIEQSGAAQGALPHGLLHAGGRVRHRDRVDVEMALPASTRPLQSGP